MANYQNLAINVPKTQSCKVKIHFQAWMLINLVNFKLLWEDDDYYFFMMLSTSEVKVIELTETLAVLLSLTMV